MEEIDGMKLYLTWDVCMFVGGVVDKFWCHKLICLIELFEFFIYIYICVCEELSC